MSVVTMKSLLNHAKEHGYAVGYFEAWNMESLLAVADAAERSHSPVILGFGGMFIGNDKRLVKENISHYGTLARAVAEESDVPMALLLNETDKLPMILQALKSGFNAVMYQDPAASFEQTLEMNKYLVPIAHAMGANVEAEVGELPSADVATGIISGGAPTDPDQAAYFVRETHIDALAAAFGNVHLLEGGQAQLDYGLIEALGKKVDVPLVMHGGTGLSDDSIRRAIKLGICKINVGTVMKRLFINHIREYLNTTAVDSFTPHEIVGIGGEKDFLCGAREAVAEKVESMMRVFGSAGQARNW
jgi:ketose-bisphosphate aldolase